MANVHEFVLAVAIVLLGLGSLASGGDRRSKYFTLSDLFTALGIAFGIIVMLVVGKIR